MASHEIGPHIGYQIAGEAALPSLGLGIGLYISLGDTVTGKMDLMKQPEVAVWPLWVLVSA